MGKNNKGQQVKDLRINTNNRRRQLSVGALIPSEWDWVRVTRTRSDLDTVWLQVKRLTMVEGG